MRKFIVYSETAHTSPVIRDLKAAGRIDVLLHSIISALFASHTFRDDVELHLIMMGPPTSPRHLIFRFNEDSTISKKNMKKTIELALRRYKDGETREVLPGVFIDNKSIQEITQEFLDNGEKVYFLNENGEHIKSFKSEDLENGVFILGDHDGFNKPVKKFLRKNTTRLSLGDQMYFTSQAITIINYELDNLNL